MNTDIPFTLKSKPLNGKQYQLAVTIYNPYTNYAIILLPNIINNLRIDNNIDSFYPSCEIIFNDTDGKYTSQLTNIGEYVRIILVPPQTTGNNSDKKTILDLTFIIDKHELLNYDPKNPTYKIYGKYISSRNFGQHLNYANNKNNGMVSPYTIIKSILTQIECKCVSQVPDTTQVINFISDQNRTAREHIQYCLYLATSINDPPAYLYFHMLDKEYVLFNRNFIPKNILYDCNNKLAISNINGNDKVDNSLIIYNFQTYMSLNALKYYQYSGDDNRWQFDAINRKWVKIQIKSQRYNDILIPQALKSTTIKSVLPIEQYQDSKIRNYQINFQHNTYQRLHDIQIGSNCIQFFVEGNILRDCGQIINITCNNNNYRNSYGGGWITYSVTHIIDGDKYSNIINGYRTFNYNSRDNYQ